MTRALAMPVPICSPIDCSFFVRIDADIKLYLFSIQYFGWKKKLGEKQISTDPAHKLCAGLTQSNLNILYFIWINEMTLSTKWWNFFVNFGISWCSACLIFKMIFPNQIVDVDRALRVKHGLDQNKKKSLDLKKKYQSPPSNKCCGKKSAFARFFFLFVFCLLLFHCGV